MLIGLRLAAASIQKVANKPGGKDLWGTNEPGFEGETRAVRRPKIRGRGSHEIILDSGDGVSDGHLRQVGTPVKTRRGHSAKRRAHQCHVCEVEDVNGYPLKFIDRAVLAQVKQTQTVDASFSFQRQFSLGVKYEMFECGEYWGVKPSIVLVDQDAACEACGSCRGRQVD